MKKLTLILLSALMVLSMVAFGACQPNLESSQSQGNTPNSSSNAPATQYTATFLVDGEIYATDTGVAGDKITKPKTNPSKDHMNFSRWEGYTNGARFSEDVSYEAVFTDIIYTVKFVSLGKTVATIEGKYGETFTVPEDPTAGSGYTFKGWQGLDLDNLVIGGNAEYIAIWDYATPSISYASTGTFDATTLEKDSIFDNATTITTFQLVQSNAKGSYTLSLVNDGEYLYLYLYAADTDNDDVDRLCFYFVKKGATTTTAVQTYPNKGMDGADATDACAAINAGKVEGGYAVKVKVAISTLEVDENNKIGFSVRLINNNTDGGGTHTVYLSEGAVADDSSNTKVTNAVNLPKMELVSAS